MRVNVSTSIQMNIQQLFPPFQLALYILSFLSPRDLLRAAQTCRYWRILAEVSNYERFNLCYEFQAKEHSEMYIGAHVNM